MNKRSGSFVLTFNGILRSTSPKSRIAAKYLSEKTLWNNRNLVQQFRGDRQMWTMYSYKQLERVLKEQFPSRCRQSSENDAGTGAL